MNIYGTVDENWAIGYRGENLVNIPNDLKYLRNLTRGKVMVTSFQALKNFPQALPLEDRTTIIFDESERVKVKGAIMVHSFEELNNELKKYSIQDVFVYGDGKLINELLPMCKRAYITKLDREYSADSFMENLDKNKAWVITDESDEMTYFDIPYEFVQYEKR